jgi:hypothetical protein
LEQFIVESKTLFLEVWFFLPKSTAEWFGTCALIAHLAGYFMYAKATLSDENKPNIAVWFIWLFGGVVELITYDHITGAHWATSSVPFACVVGLIAITGAITYKQVTAWWHKTKFECHKPTWDDYLVIVFDGGAFMYWYFIATPEAAFYANAFAVGTSIFTFWPIWKTTWKEPRSENPSMWLVWSSAYTLMMCAAITSGSSDVWELYVYPIIYLVLHLTVALLALRHRGLKHQPAE